MVYYFCMRYLLPSLLLLCNITNGLLLPENVCYIHCSAVFFQMSLLNVSFDMQILETT